MSHDILVMFVRAYKSSNILAHFLAVRCCLAVVGMLLLATGVDLLDSMHTIELTKLLNCSHHLSAGTEAVLNQENQLQQAFTY